MTNRKKKSHLFWVKGFIWGLLIALTLLETHSLTTDKLSSYQPTRTNPDSRLTKGSYASHDPISVTNDAELEEISTGGTGTSGDPFIIEGWNITTTTADGICITGTTKCFIVRNCWVKTTYAYGIHIYDVGNDTATIANNMCNDNGLYSICLYYSASSTIANNTCNDNKYYGICLGHSASSTIANNTCNYNRHYGINLENSGSSTVINNTCNDNGDEGICLGHSASSTVANNTCNDNGRYGINLCYSASSTVANNTCNDNGFFIYECSKEDYLSYAIMDNEVNGLPLGYFENLTTSTITKAYGQLILVSCSNISVQNQNYSNASVGIALFFCSECHLINNTCNNGFYGIRLRYSGSSTVVNNTYSNNGYCGNSLYASASSTIANNTCNDNDWYGICLSASASSTIANNTCNYNRHYGISLWYSASSTIVNNMFNDNGDDGVYLRDSDEVVVCWNRLTANVNYGVFLDSASDDNVLHHNYFIDNNGSDAQAYDEGENNKWYEQQSLEGNYWSDYEGTGDYPIAGSANVVDPYPFCHSLPVPVIIDPNGGETLGGTVTIEWTAATDSGCHCVNYNVSYSDDNGNTWTNIAVRLTTTSYDWDTTTLLNGTDYLVKVVATCSEGLIAEDMSDGTFTIRNAAHTLSTPIVVYPSGGETINGTVTIEWMAANDSWNHTVTYEIFYSADSGGTWTPLATDLTTINYDWDTTTLIDGTDYLVKVVATCSEGLTSEDASDGTFTISTHISTTLSSTSETSVASPGFKIVLFVVGILVLLLRRKKVLL